MYDIQSLAAFEGVQELTGGPQAAA